jgi:hypothetical protein
MGKLGERWDRWVERVNADEPADEVEREPPAALAHPAGLAIVCATFVGMFFLFMWVGVAEWNDAIKVAAAVLFAVAAFRGIRKKRAEQRADDAHRIRTADARHRRPASS